MSDVRWSDLMEDMIGFGARSLRSIRDLIVRPRAYFLAAQTADWSGYTPSFRIYIALVALSSLLTHFFVGDAGMMTELYAAQFDQIFTELAGENPDYGRMDAATAAQATLDFLFRWLPFAQFIGYTLLGLLWRAYGERLSAPVRVRYIYAAFIPALLLGLTSSLVMLLAADSAVSASFLGMGLTPLVVAAVAFRGAYPQHLPTGERLIRAAILGVAVLAMMTLVTLIVVVSGMGLAIGDGLSALHAADAAAGA